MAKRKVNKSAKIREYLDDHPAAGPAETARALQQFGVTPAHVSNVKSRSNVTTAKKAGRRKKRRRVGRPRAANRNGAARRRPAQVDSIVAAAKFIRDCGGIDQAKAALSTAEKIASALH